MIAVPYFPNAPMSSVFSTVVFFQEQCLQLVGDCCICSHVWFHVQL